MARRRDIERLRSEMEELFADLCQVPRLVSQAGGFRPRLDVYRIDDPPTITVVAELAGVDPAQVEVTVGDGALVVAGTRRRETRVHAVYQQMELDYGAFQRRVPLDERIDPDGIEAVYDRGLLRITLPIAARRSGRVKVAVTPRSAT